MAEPIKGGAVSLQVSKNRRTGHYYFKTYIAGARGLKKYAFGWSVVQKNRTKISNFF